MSSEKVDVIRVAEISLIFQSKGWLRSGKGHDDIMLAFKNICLISSNLSADQYELLKILLVNYTKIEFESYLPSLQAALEKVPNPAYKNAAFRVLPLVAPKDVGKNKSGPALLYFFEHAVWGRSAKFSGLKLKAFTSTDRLPKNKPKNPVVTFVIDDFIGSGGTAAEFLEYYEQNHKVDGEKVIFLSVAAMQSGLSAIQAKGYEIYCDITLPKGIADCVELANKAHAYSIMDELEAKVKRSEDYKYGYEKSEGLVTLMRTPNNTFPFFWAAEASSGHAWPAPFPR